MDWKDGDKKSQFNGGTFLELQSCKVCPVGCAKDKLKKVIKCPKSTQSYKYG